MPRPTLSQVEVDSFREQIKATGYQMICEEGAASLTLRRLALRLNCSYAKLYRYYPSKDVLVDAVRGYAFDQFTLYITAISDSAGTPLSVRYLRFALEHPEPFRLMFELKQNYYSPETRAAQARAWKISAQPFHDWASQGRISEDPEIAAHIYWVAFHGLATLSLSENLNHGMSVEQIAQALTDRLLGNLFLVEKKEASPEEPGRSRGQLVGKSR